MTSFAATSRRGPTRASSSEPPRRRAVCDGEPGRWTWAELSGAVGRLASVLVASGVRPDDVVGVQNLTVTHPAVAEASAVGYPDPVMGERTCVFVVLHPGRTLELDDLCAHLASRRIASYKQPERLVVVEALPRNPVGKVVKADPRRLLADEQPALGSTAT